MRGQVTKLICIDSFNGYFFGFSIAISGNTAFVATAGNDSAYIFERNVNGGNNWGELQKITESDGTSGFAYQLLIS